MKITNTGFKKDVNGSSSFILYISNNNAIADNLYSALNTQREMLNSNDWYYHVSMNEIIKDCRVPEFFHNRGYQLVCVEHNNGDWKKEPTYTLYIAE
jgi:hypothetical protein